MTQGGAHYDYLYDGKGNVRAVLDGNQNVVASYAYDAFGVQTGQSGTLDQPYRFSTKRYYDDIGLNYYGYRFYAPRLGRWMTRDPLGEKGGLNLYGFVGNGPMNIIDPYGLIYSITPEEWYSMSPDEQYAWYNGYQRAISAGKRVGMDPHLFDDPNPVVYKIPTELIDCLRRKFNIATQVALWEVSLAAEDITLGVELEALGFEVAGPIGAIGVAPGSVALIGTGGYEMYIAGKELLEVVKECLKECSDDSH